ncbi:peptidase [Chitinophaga agrisoli]|uniref:Peptidase n=1 Tax=Chitinophaga agrisoli TaxID=2607653 RepID=A0A5B2VL66_9BACT|nr:S24 family peptidase [Chitinophaga agrisoli]KAA2239725.1 peptidase [Chitinophaga agrisoli]
MDDTIGTTLPTAYEPPTENIDLLKVLQPHPGSTFLIRIADSSMQDANMPIGSLAVVERTAKPVSGAIVVAMLDNEITVKRLVKAGRNWVLHPENAFHKPLLITEEMEFRVLGVVTHVIVDLRK